MKSKISFEFAKPLVTTLGQVNTILSELTSGFEHVEDSCPFLMSCVCASNLG